jgi:hypothetical protein
MRIPDGNRGEIPHRRFVAEYGIATCKQIQWEVDPLRGGQSDET